MNKWDKKLCKFIIDCQLIEDNLKLIIKICGINVNLCLVNAKITKIRIKTDENYLDTANMRRLIKELDKLLDDHELISQLGQLRKTRDEIVHENFIRHIKELNEFKIPDKEVDDYMDSNLDNELINGLKLSKICKEKLENTLSYLDNIYDLLNNPQIPS